MFNLPAPWFAAIFVIVQAGSLYPIFAHHVPSINDLQNHLARVWILLHYGDLPAIHQFYRVHWQMLPNLAIDAFGFVVGRFVSLDMTGKLFIAATFVLLLSGVVHLHRAVFGRWSCWPLLAAFFLFNRPFLFGFATFLAAVGLYLHAVALWVRQRERSVLWRVTCSSILALAIFFAHLFALGLLGLTIFAVELVRAARERWGAARAVRNFALAGIPFVVPVLIFLFLTPHGHAQVALSYRDVAARIRAFGAPICYDASLDVLLMAVIAAVAGVLALKAKARVASGLAAAVSLLVVAQFLMPNGLFTALGADHRIPIALCFLALAGSDLSGVSRRAQWAFAAVAVTVPGVRVWSIDAAWTSFDPVYADVEDALASLPPSAAVATAYPVDSFDSGGAPAIAVFYLPLRDAVEHGGFSQPLFAFPTQNPVVLQPEYRELAEVWPGDAVWRRFVASGKDGIEGQPDRHQLETLRRFDYVVFVTDGTPFRVPPTPLLSPVRQGRWAQVYRVQK